MGESMAKLIWLTATLVLLGGCGAFLANEPLDLPDQLWRDAKGIRY